TFALTVGPVALAPPQTFAYGGPPVVVPDGAGPNTPGPRAAVTVTVPSTGTVGAVAARVYVPSSAMGDLSLQLTSPGGVTVTLAHRVGGTGGGYGSPTADLVFTDDALASIESASAFVGPYRPQNPLRALAGGPAAGVWTLSAQDHNQFDVSQVVRFAIDLQTMTGTCPSPITPSVTFSTTVEGRVVSVTFFTVTTMGGVTITPWPLTATASLTDLVGLPFAYSAQTTVQAQSARVCLTHHAADLVGVDPSTLRLLFWRNEQWQSALSTNDLLQRAVCADTSTIAPTRTAGLPLIGPNARLGPVLTRNRSGD
ncbi:MAG: proprotein convertase P-domain-containing protein, partial [Dehalococcoidia bacterium]|nr:proprotein convertase P-domain-containing protein [Dehalococcoidia bacterium]